MNDFEPEKEEDVEREPLPVVFEAEEDDEEEDFVEDVLPDEDFDEDFDEEEEDDDEEDPSSRAPQVSLALSSTSWAERDTDGLCSDSPGSSIAVSSYGVKRSSMIPLPTGLSPGAAERIGMAQTDAAIAVRIRFIAETPVCSGVFGLPAARPEIIFFPILYDRFPKKSNECGRFF